MKEYLVIFAQLLCVGWLLRTMSKARGKLDEEELGWFDIRLGGKQPKQAKSPKTPPPAPKPAASDRAGEGRGPRA
ncbi:hypothetical protein H5407_10370 [Mitsuaria sp. WAJ17]|uniref:hypothetical protein n=1 Tax=Mitsuaria sp. WAJ17 TaxID=2761452 RepID=UPI0016013157|nr:hypothetical protein [Mitsuaria sp. WAJ17]MBB2485627.1 hypothetical protein [Mitsuaria sp. WAJ17]